MLDDLRQRLGLGHPALDFTHGGLRADDLVLVVVLCHRRGQVRRVALGQLGGRVDAGGLEQVGVLGAYALEAHEITVVDPLEDQRRVDPGRLGELVAPIGRGADGEQLVGRLDPCRAELGSLGRADTLDLFDLHWIRSLQVHLPASHRSRKVAGGPVPTHPTPAERGSRCGASGLGLKALGTTCHPATRLR